MIQESISFARKFNLVTEDSHFSLIFKNHEEYLKARELLNNNNVPHLENVLTTDQLFNELQSKVASIKESDADKAFFSELSNLYQKTRKTYTNYQKKIECFHSSLFKYIYSTLVSLEVYNHLFKKEIIKSLEILIFTTQEPMLLEGKKHSDHTKNPYFETAKALDDYYSNFKILTKDFTVSRYFLVSEATDFDIMVSRDTLKNNIVFTKTQMANVINVWINDLVLILEKKFLKRNNFNITFFNPDELGTNPEFRDFIAFKVDGKWDIAFSTNLSNNSTSLFLKKWNNLQLKDITIPFYFLGNNENKSFIEFIDEVKNKKTNVSLSDFWGLEEKEPQPKETKNNKTKKIKLKKI